MQNSVNNDTWKSQVDEVIDSVAVMFVLLYLIAAVLTGAAHWVLHRIWHRFTGAVRRSFISGS